MLTEFKGNNGATGQGSEELMPAVAYSTDHYAIFFYADKDLASKTGQCSQGPVGRINLTPLTYHTPDGRQIILPNLTAEPNGRVAVSPPPHERHELYQGMEGLSRFLKVHPVFEIYRPYFTEILGKEIPKYVENLDTKLTAA